jgi:hypothetical protein
MFDYSPRVESTCTKGGRNAGLIQTLSGRRLAASLRVFLEEQIAIMFQLEHFVSAGMCAVCICTILRKRDELRELARSSTRGHRVLRNGRLAKSGCGLPVESAAKILLIAEMDRSGQECPLHPYRSTPLLRFHSLRRLQIGREFGGRSA